MIGCGCQFSRKKKKINISGSSLCWHCPYRGLSGMMVGWAVGDVYNIDLAGGDI